LAVVLEAGGDALVLRSSLALDSNGLFNLLDLLDGVFTAVEAGKDGDGFVLATLFGVPARRFGRPLSA
jgi:hypothetical protein